MADSSIILHSELNLQDRYKNAKFLTSTKKQSSLLSERFRLVSEQRRTEEQHFRFWPKNERGGRERGRKETLADKPRNFENLRLPANGAPDWLG